MFSFFKKKIIVPHIRLAGVIGSDESAAAVTPGTLAAEARSLGFANSNAWQDSLDNPPISL